MLAAGIAHAEGNEVNEPNRPNVLLIYADDLGYGDASTLGGAPIRTSREATRR